MNIQIFGRSKCFDTKKAERWFKERRIPVQRVDVDRFGMSLGELRSVAQSVGGVDRLLREDSRDPEAALFPYLATQEAKFQKLLDFPSLLVSPIVRNGKKATLGYQPEVWKDWE